MKTLTSVEAKTNFGSILDAVEKGEEVIVTRHGKQVARIVPAGAPSISRTDAFARLKTFAKDRNLALGDVSWRDLRDAGRK